MTEQANGGARPMSVGVHEYTPLPFAARCALCFLQDGDCPSSPSWTVDRPDGRYFHSAQHPILLQTLGDATTIYVHEDDFYSTQTRADDAERDLAFINAVLTDPSLSSLAKIGSAVAILRRHGLTTGDGAAMRGVLRWATANRDKKRSTMTTKVDA